MNRQAKNKLILKKITTEKGFKLRKMKENFHLRNSTSIFSSLFTVKSSYYKKYFEYLLISLSFLSIWESNEEILRSIRGWLLRSQEKRNHNRSVTNSMFDSSSIRYNRASMADHFTRNELYWANMDRQAKNK